MLLGKNLSEQGRNNRTAMIAHMTTAIIMVLFCGYQVISGFRSPVLFVFDIILGLAPVFMERYYFAKNPNTDMIRHLVAIGFAIFYTYVMFSAETYLVYVMAMPIIFVVTVYHDTKLILQINAGAFTIQIIVAIIAMTTGKYGYARMDDAVIQIVVMGMIAAFSHWSAKTILANNKAQLDEANTAKEEAENLLESVQEMSEKMTDGITKTNVDLNKVKLASQKTMEAMKQLSTGADQTANTIMEQTVQTEQIQNKVDSITDVSNNIMTKMSETMKAISQGRDDIKKLVTQVETSVDDGAKVADKLATLDKYVEEMHDIVKIISGIANQTSMLALNASIEAARAGEAGRGFAVVATQVTNMAGQTKDATVKISDLIDAVSTAIEDVIAVIKQMLEGINQEKESSEATVQSFRNIRTNTNEVNDNMTELTRSIDELGEANKVIVESTMTISAISQEVLAQTNETSQAQNENNKAIEDMAAEMKKLLDFINNK